MPMQRIVLSLPPELLAQIDEVREDVPRAAWFRRAAEERVNLLKLQGTATRYLGPASV